jgi:putative transposase
VDDATRYVLHGQFYPVLDQVIVEDCFRQAVLKHGVPESVYFDNGKQYRTKWMTRACSKLGIKLLFAKPYSPEATGKVERFNRVVDSFLAESHLEKPRTLDRLNELFDVWLSECYQNKPHSALGGKSPYTAFQSDSKPLKFLASEIITNAFLHCEERKVDKAGCISFMSKKYEVGLQFIGCKVDVVYDPADISELTIEYEGHKPFQVRELVIGPRAGQRPKLPDYTQIEIAECSRLLAAAELKSQERKEQQAHAVSYRTVKKEADANV